MIRMDYHEEDRTRHEYWDLDKLDLPEGHRNRKPEYVCYSYYTCKSNGHEILNENKYVGIKDVMQVLTELGLGDEENGAEPEYMKALQDVAKVIKELKPNQFIILDIESTMNKNTKKEESYKTILNKFNQWCI